MVFEELPPLLVRWHFAPWQTRRRTCQALPVSAHHGLATNTVTGEATAADPAIESFAGATNHTKECVGVPQLLPLFKVSLGWPSAGFHRANRCIGRLQRHGAACIVGGLAGRQTFPHTCCSSIFTGWQQQWQLQCLARRPFAETTATRAAGGATTRCSVGGEDCPPVWHRGLRRRGRCPTWTRPMAPLPRHSPAAVATSRGHCQPRDCQRELQTEAAFTSHRRHRCQRCELRGG
mmetsp:Transcript_103159/g.204941  ORF Transcript_103159/g.204941 Transcript_103159/m.204941 type:complete len:234 (-) Transcript_103159:431-1132(-)